MNSKALHKIDLARMKLQTIVDQRTLRKPRGCTRLWLDDLLAVREDEEALIVKVAYEIGKLGGNRRVDYYVAELTLSNLAIRRIMNLPAAFA